MELNQQESCRYCEGQHDYVSSTCVLSLINNFSTNTVSGFAGSQFDYVLLVL